MAVVVISRVLKGWIWVFLILSPQVLISQSAHDTVIYKKRVLESVEIDFLTSYYQQDGSNSAVSGGVGTEKLTDLTPTVVVAIPLNEDDVLSIDAGISAYSSASSSNINPFDQQGQEASPFQASSGASRSDVYANLTTTYRHSSDDRNTIWSAKIAAAAEYDYVSLGIGGSITRLFNEKNTELTINGNVYFDTWSAIYPIELRTFLRGPGDSDSGFDFGQYTITGNPNYNPVRFTEFDQEKRRSYSLGLNFSQILSRSIQTSLSLDVIAQNGLLSTPYQRVYFADVADSFIEGFQLADDVERLPENRIKVAVGGRLNYFVSSRFSVRSYYRFYGDDWGISSHTASLSIPFKANDRFTLYPDYRFYTQTAADYFAAFEEHISSDEFYTSDYDLSNFTAHQYGFGVRYTDIFTKTKLFRFGIKSVDLKFSYYQRDTGLDAFIISTGVKFVLEK